MLKDGEPLRMADYARRATLRHLRLHACACMRLNPPKRPKKELFWLLEVSERYADGEIQADELETTRSSWPKQRLPRGWRNNFDWAFMSDGGLQASWDGSIYQNRTIRPDESDYKLALPRYRVFEELIGPDPLPVFAPEWRTDTALALAKQMYDAREFSAMPILADALQDAGCDNEELLSHCRVGGRHVRGCWVIDLVLGKA
jgi:hypothetical protein